MDPQSSHIECKRPTIFVLVPNLPKPPSATLTLWLRQIGNKYMYMYTISLGTYSKPQQYCPPTGML